MHVKLLNDIYNHKDGILLKQGPIRHAYAWQIGPFWQDTLDIKSLMIELKFRTCN